jgi:alkylation response protein AidB-like acyl-CoA dehydrogenase
VNILNIGRIKLAGGTVGGAKAVVDHCVQYANERLQFGKPISSFGAIRQKLADQADLLLRGGERHLPVQP